MSNCKLIRCCRITCVFVFALAIIVPSAIAHMAEPIGSTNALIGTSLLVKMFENPGSNCTAICALSIDKPQLAAVLETPILVGPNHPAYWKVVINPKNTGVATLTYHFIGEDKYNGNPDGPCQGEGTYNLSIRVYKPLPSVLMQIGVLQLLLKGP